MKYKALTVFVVCALVLLTVISAVYASAPTIDSIADQSATVGNEFSLTVTGSSTDGSPIAFDAEELSCLTCAATSTFPSGSLIYRDVEEAELLWTPTTADVGQHEIQVRAFNSAGDESFETFSISVTDPNDQPVIAAIADKTVVEAHQLSFQFTVEDLDLDDTLTVDSSSSVNPSSSTLDLDTAISLTSTDGTTRTFTLTWNPTVTDRGTYDVTLLVTDGSFPSAAETFTLEVEANSAASITTTTLPDATQSQAYSETVVANDADGDSLSFSLGSDAPSGMSIGSSTGVISWTPSDADVGTVSFTVSVTDGIQEAPTQRTYSIEVIDTNDSPALESSSFTVEEGNSLSATLFVVDGDGDAVTLVSGPTTSSSRANESVNFGSFTSVSTGRYSMTLNWDSTTSADVGEYSFTVELDDGTGSVTRTFTIEVTEDITQEEANVRDLEDQFDLIDDDVDELDDDLDRAIRRDDDDDIEDAEDDLEDLRDNELDDLRSDVEDELDDVEDNDDLDNDLQDDLEDRLNDLLDDIEALEEDIDNLVDCGRRNCSSSSTSGSSTTFVNAGTTTVPSNSGGSSTGSSSGSSSSGTSPQVSVVTVPAPANSGITGATTTTTQGTSWEDFRWIFLMGAAIVVAFAVLIFLLALAFGGSKKRRR